MCGFVGFFPCAPGQDSERILLGMASALKHRGPDSDGSWIDAEDKVALAHRRLSVVDLSQHGSQPMVSPSGQYVIVYNGEIYNHLSIRQLISDPPGGWRGSSDTETLLAAIEKWGIVEALSRVVGMFAFALWDRQRKTLTLARDRLGEKPLYWGWQNGTLLFGSELKALCKHPGFRKEIDRNSLSLFTRYGYVPAPYSIYRGVSKLMPGHYLSIPLSQEGNLTSCVEQSKPYWSINDTVRQGIANPFLGDDDAAIDMLERQLQETIHDQMLADVPVGAFFSGGIDSSVVVSLMQGMSSKPVQTFTVGLGKNDNDEAQHAETVAEYLKTEHRSLIVRPEDALDVVPLLPKIYCEPLSADSQIPLYLISGLARQHVTVSLSGDGGDELFGGYNRYLSALKVWKKLQAIPKPLRHVVSQILSSVSPANWDLLFSYIRPALPAKYRLAIPGTKAQKLAGVLKVDSEHDYFLNLISHWKNVNELVLNSVEVPTIATDATKWVEADCFEHWMMAMDTQTFLPDEVMTKVDRAAMANSLETRAPLLDHRVVELAWRMPLDKKIRDGEGKWILRQVLYRHVPKQVIDKPKKGFGIPIDEWLRGPLKEWAEKLLDKDRLREEGYFNADLVYEKWRQHLTGKYSWQYQLWPILMFQAWLENERGD